MGACCQTNSEEIKTEVVLPPAAPLAVTPLGTNEREDIALKKEIEDIW